MLLGYIPIGKVHLGAEAKKCSQPNLRTFEAFVLGSFFLQKGRLVD